LTKSFENIPETPSIFEFFGHYYIFEAGVRLGALKILKRPNQFSHFSIMLHPTKCSEFSSQEIIWLLRTTVFFFRCTMMARIRVFAYWLAQDYHSAQYRRSRIWETMCIWVSVWVRPTLTSSRDQGKLSKSLVGTLNNIMLSLADTHYSATWTANISTFLLKKEKTFFVYTKLFFCSSLLFFQKRFWQQSEWAHLNKNL
jgi:hypothetical protein